MKRVPLMVNAFDAAAAPPLSPMTQSLLERRSRVLGPSYRLMSITTFRPSGIAIRAWLRHRPARRLSSTRTPAT